MSNILTGLDIGTSKIRAVIAERLQSGALQITGVGVADSEGLRRGEVINIEKTVEGIKKAIEDAEYQAGTEVTECLVSIGGVDADGFNSTGVVGISSKGKNVQSVDEADIENVIRSAQAVQLSSDREFIHVIPQTYRVDKQNNIKDPKNMIGVRLEANVHIITGSASSIQKIIQCVNRSNLQVIGTMHQSLCAVKSVMTTDEMELGSVLIDIGGAITNVIVMKDGAPYLTFALDIGGYQVTNDIAKVEGIPFDAAEKIKIENGCCNLDLIDNDEAILVAGLGGRAPIEISKVHITEVLQYRMQELFLIIKNRLQENLKHHFISGSIVLCGGGSLLSGSTELAASVFGMNSVRLGIPSTLGDVSGGYRSPEFAVVLGLLLEQNEHNAAIDVSNTKSKEKNGFGEKIKDIWNNLFN